MEDFIDFFIKPVTDKWKTLSKIKKITFSFIFAILLSISCILVFSQKIPDYLRAPLTIRDWSWNMGGGSTRSR
jgi:hypothetical protein